MAGRQTYDVVIVGGGVSGTSLLYTLANFTDIPRLALIEKHDDLAQVNSYHDNNSQTLHFGDIETNYSLEKAKHVKEAAGLVAAYVEKHEECLSNRTHKMVLAVGDEESERLEGRYEEFKGTYPNLEKIGREVLANIDPKIVEGRPENERLLALCTFSGYAVNYEELAKSFVREAKGSGKDIDVLLGRKVDEQIRRDGGEYVLRCGESEYRAKAVVVAAGSHSLIFAQKLGYAQEYGLLPVAGSFYCAGYQLNGKVYTMQIEKLPFAAVHGDPQVDDPRGTRFGPTAKVVPMLERRNWKTVKDFLKVSVWSWSGVASLLSILSDPVILRFVLKNLLFDIPFFGRWLYLQEARKIVPSLRYSDLHFAYGVGGVRPQLVNTDTRELEMGEAKFTGDNIIFNVTPSPGASVCLRSARDDAEKIIEFFGGAYTFDMERFKQVHTVDLEKVIENDTPRRERESVSAGFSL